MSQTAPNEVAGCREEFLSRHVDGRHLLLQLRCVSARATMALVLHGGGLDAIGGDAAAVDVLHLVHGQAIRHAGARSYGVGFRGRRRG